MSALVYLHIPKVAGTSHRQYLEQVYGEEAMFWYGLDSEAAKFSQRELDSARIVGGHRPLKFYPKSYRALYTTLLRDPVERAVSLFNYRSAQPRAGAPEWKKQREAEVEHWRSKGVDPSSMIRSIEKCPKFRRELQNYHCYYLSRHGATFAGVRKTLQEENMIIGLTEQFQQFNDFLRTEFLYPWENKQKANAGKSGYSAEVLAEPGLVELIRSLNKEDQRLYDFVRFEHHGLYVGVEDFASVKKQLPKPRGELAHPPEPINWKAVQLFSKGLVAKIPGKLRIPLVIQNGTTQELVFSTKDRSGSAIGWQFRDATSKAIASLQGIAYIDQIIPPRGINQLIIELSLDEDNFRRESPRSVEFSFVENNRQVRDEFPMTSCWAVL